MLICIFSFDIVRFPCRSNYSFLRCVFSISLISFWKFGFISVVCTTVVPFVRLFGITVTKCIQYHKIRWSVIIIKIVRLNIFPEKKTRVQFFFDVRNDYNSTTLVWDCSSWETSKMNVQVTSWNNGRKMNVQSGKKKNLLLLQILAKFLIGRIVNCFVICIVLLPVISRVGDKKWTPTNYESVKNRMDEINKI